MIKGAIFDIDGTLLDSMPIWENAGARYLATLGIKAKPDLKERLDALSLPEGAIYMQKEYGLSVSAEDILEGVNQVVKDFYYKEAVMKPGAYALVKRLKENGVKLIIATATDKEMAKAALIRNDIWQDFTGMITCEEAGAGKTSPKVFEFARQKLGTKKEETWVFEDSLYAVKTATEAGFPVCSIYDTYSVGNAKEIQKLSNIYVRDFSEIGDYSFSNMKTVLTIAGSDSSGGAGIQADIKTISALGGYAASVITAVTVQNTLGVHAVQSVLPEIVRGQIEAVMDDLQPVAIKIGMVSDIQIVRTIVDCLREYIPEYIVYDPVMVSTSGRKLMSDETIEEIKRELLPLVTLITPNLDEASVLTDKSIHNIHEMQEAAKRLVDEYQTSVLIKGGHLEGDRMCDLLHTSESIFHIYEEKKIESNNLHGTGCTLSSAIATNLAKGYPLRESIQHAKSYITQAIIAGKDLHIGHGNGPLWHFPDSVAQICTFCAVVS